MGAGEGVRVVLLRRQGALRVHGEGLWHVRPRERPPARHRSERHTLRRRDHRDGPRPHARLGRGRARPRPGRSRHQRWHRKHRPRHARLSRGRLCQGQPHAQRDQARDRPSGLRQGVSPVRHRDASRPDRPAHHAGRHRRHGGDDRRPHGRHHRLGVELRLRHHRPHRSAFGTRHRARHRPSRRRLPRRLHPPLRRDARLRHRTLRLPHPRRHLDLRRHP